MRAQRLDLAQGPDPGFLPQDQDVVAPRRVPQMYMGVDRTVKDLRPMPASATASHNAGGIGSCKAASAASSSSRDATPRSVVETRASRPGNCRAAANRLTPASAVRTASPRASSRTELEAG